MFQIILIFPIRHKYSYLLYRSTVFIIDDSLYERAGFKRTELASRVFDHVSMRFKKGFRLLTLGWTDGCTFLPINYSLLASNDDEKVLGPCNKIDRRTIAGKRRLMARQKATSVMVDLLKTALAAGHKAKYVLFDSWFSNPQQQEILHLRRKIHGHQEDFCHQQETPGPLP